MHPVFRQRLRSGHDVLSLVYYRWAASCCRAPFHEKRQDFLLTHVPDAHVSRGRKQSEKQTLRIAVFQGLGLGGNLVGFPYRGHPVIFSAAG